MRRIKPIGPAWALLLVVAVASGADESLIENGDFAEWSAGAPVGWRVELGARNGTGPPSELAQAGGPALTLRGDESTRIWNLVAQSFRVEPGAYYRCIFEARSSDVRREGHQYDNCYVGLAAKDASGKRLSAEIRTIDHEAWLSHTLPMRAPAQAFEFDAMIFLSKSGVLGVRDVHVEQVGLEDRFDLLVDEMDRKYSFFALKKIDWRALAARYRRRAESAVDSEQFAKVVVEMLSELDDLHVHVVTPARKLLPTVTSMPKPNVDFRAVAGQLAGAQQIGRIGLVGRTAEGFGYVAVVSLGGDEAEFDRLAAATARLLDAPGLLVDLRGNGGGDERRAERIAGMFTEQPLVYAKSQFRAGAEHDAFGPAHERVLEPLGGAASVKPIVCLLGPRCVSSGEGFALMMKALPNITLVGQPTRGASGNPAPLELPGGVIVYYSRWMSLTPDGTPIEGRGIEPDVFVKHEGPGDPTFEAAVKALRKKVAATN